VHLKIQAKKSPKSLVKMPSSSTLVADPSINPGFIAADSSSTVDKSHLHHGYEQKKKTLLLSSFPGAVPLFFFFVFFFFFFGMRSLQLKDKY
jgi:hypothetical protein